MFYEKERTPTSTNLYLVREVKENLNFARHMHRSLEIIDVLDGEIYVTLYHSDREYVINADSAALILPYQVHSYRRAVKVDHDYFFTRLCQNLL